MGKRQAQVMQKLREGKYPTQIARELGIKPGTVKGYVHRLGLKSKSMGGCGSVSVLLAMR